MTNRGSMYGCRTNLFPPLFNCFNESTQLFGFEWKERRGRPGRHIANITRCYSFLFDRLVFVLFSSLHRLFHFVRTPFAGVDGLSRRGQKVYSVVVVVPLPYGCREIESRTRSETLPTWYSLLDLLECTKLIFCHEEKSCALFVKCPSRREGMSQAASSSVSSGVMGKKKSSPLSVSNADHLTISRRNISNMPSWGAGSNDPWRVVLFLGHFLEIKSVMTRSYRRSQFSEE